MLDDETNRSLTVSSLTSVLFLLLKLDSIDCPIFDSVDLFLLPAQINY